MDLRHNMNDALELLVVSELTPLGLSLFELRKRGSASRPVLDVRVERADGVAVTVDDCARASRALEARLDSERVVGDRYVLEVSSPGIERPLRGAADWRRFAGQRAQVTSDALGGHAEVTILGVEGDEGNETAIVRVGRDREVSLPLAAVRAARLAFDWKR